MVPADPLRVALVIDDSLDSTDGVQQSVLALGRWLSEQGHTVHYVTSHTTRTDLTNLHSVAESVPVRFNRNRLRIPLPARSEAVRQVLTAADFDVVHVQMPYSPLLAGRLISRLAPEVALVGTFHILPATRLAAVAGRALALWQRRQIPRFDALIAVSGPAADYVRAILGRPARTVPNPVPTAAAVARSTAPRSPDPEIGTAARPARVTFLGRMVPRKGPGHLLDAVAHLERTTDLVLDITLAGAGPELLGLQRRAHELRSRVTFPGRIAEEDKERLLAEADVVALPATGGESFGISVVEALACATGPVIAGDNPGYRSVMGDLTDQLVDAANPEAFAAVLERAVRDQDARAAVVERQHRRALTFDVAAVSEAVLGVYRDAIAARAPQRLTR